MAPRSTRPLTDSAISNFEPPHSGQREVFDGRVPGFCIRISKGGARSFCLYYRTKGGSRRRLTLGRYPDLRLGEARVLAHRARAEVAVGKDPQAERKAVKRDRGAYEFSAFVCFFIENYAKRKNRSWPETERLLKIEFVSVWGKRDIREISKQDVAVVLDQIVHRGTPSAANHAFAAIRKLFNWAVERDLLRRSPCDGLKQPSKVVSRDRVLTAAELTALWEATEDIGYPSGHFVQLLILTAQRLGEVSSMRWDEVDLEQSLWTIPASRNKSGRPHTVPLSRCAVNVLQRIPHMANGFVFPSRTANRSASGFSKWKIRMDVASGVVDWRFHDLRRTAATGMAKLKVQPHVLERVLNHTSGSLGGVAGIYNRFGYLDDMRDALESWASNVNQCIHARIDACPEMASG